MVYKVGEVGEVDKVDEVYMVDEVDFRKETPVPYPFTTDGNSGRNR